MLISRENLGDLVLTRKFQTFVREQHFQPVFCHKADPESKGKVENVVKYVKENFLVARVFRDIDSLNREALEWLERTGNGKVHGTTRLVPREEFAVEKSFLIPYHGTPQPPQEEMREYHVRKDNTASRKKSNKPKAIPKLLKYLELAECITTMNTITCQRDIVKAVAKAKADYVICVKKNQKKLHDTIRSWFDELDMEGNKVNRHGREEKR